ncbi:CaiB/BaiF CoA transferase family protein [Novosphingobium naphthalenivorans]|uniref:CaiB/BaiF CoA transferase family protein n=1 Tax=Novosphingobium naphthalenivorans TaxID=273168 RepID=UPI000829B43B|nr:CoA transferase [Novosphingobium naphthalenivorans]
MSSQPLSGIKVLDLSRVLAAPFAGQMLSDLGAEVIKVESMGGDDTRTWGTHYFRAINRGKKSIAVNLKDPRGQELVRRLALRSDILLENFKVGDLARYGLDYPTLSQSNPGLIYLSVTGFGQTGPRSSQPGYDTIIQGMTGIMTLCGEPDRPPARAGLPMVDIMSGMVGSVGILAALHERGRSGMGQHIDISLFDVGIMMLVDAGQDYLDHDHVQSRLGGINRNFSPGQPFQTNDGWVTLAVATNDQFRRMCNAMALPDLPDDPRFVDNTARVTNRAELSAILAPKFAAGSTREWEACFKAAMVPLSPIFNVAEAFAEEQSAARNLVWNMGNSLRLIANPLQHMSRTPARPVGPPPEWNQDLESILRDELAIEGNELQELVDAGVLGKPLH